MDETNKLQIESKRANIDNLKRELKEVSLQRPFIEKKIEMLDEEAKILDERTTIILDNYVYLGEKKWKFEELDSYRALQRRIEKISFAKQKLQLEEQRYKLVDTINRMKEREGSLQKELDRVVPELEKLEKGE